MAQGRSRLGAVILEEHQMPQSEVVSEIKKSCSVGDKNIGNFCRGEISHPFAMIRSFDNDFVRAYSVTDIIETVAPAFHLTFDSQCRIFIGYYPHLPAWIVRLTVTSDRKYFRGRLPLEPVAERADVAGREDLLHMEVPRPAPSFGSNNYPMFFKRVPPQF